jgi:phosphoserine phosphatase
VAHRAGLQTLLVTGGFGVLARRLQRRLRIGSVVANELGMRGGRLTGSVSGPFWDVSTIVDADGKARALLQACERLGCGAGRAIAIGDGANDAPMLRHAGLSVAWRAKPVARAAARLCLDHSGLDGVLSWFGA